MRPTRWLYAILYTVTALGSVSALGSSAFSSAQQPKPLPYLDPSLPPEKRAADLVGRLTLAEKISQMNNASAAISRLNVPAYNWWSEALHGVSRAGYATLFPQAIGLAATWDAPRLKQVGEIISIEGRAKNTDALLHNNHEIYYGLTFWSPNINIFRDPRWGRGQETYGEDPYLTSRLGVNLVEGMQGDDPSFYRVIATPKHFAVHSGPENARHNFNSVATEHDLWDTYLPAFRATIVEAKADSIMCSYNRLDGTPACGSDLLLKTILRDDWHFHGFVTSDCGAIDDFSSPKGHHTSPDPEHASATALLAGTDTACGQTYKALTGAVQQKLIAESDIDTSLRRLFEARIRLGLFDDPARVPYTAIPITEVNSPAHQLAALQVANESMVLLKNDGTLPLDPHTRKTIAVIGPNVDSLAVLEGNYNAIPNTPQMPLEALHEELPNAHLLYAQGAPYADSVPLIVPRTMFHPELHSVANGLKAEYFSSAGIGDKPAFTRVDPTIDFDWQAASPAAGIPAEAFAVRWTGMIQPPAPGTYSFTMQLAECGPCHDEEHYTLTLDGRSVSDFTGNHRSVKGANKFTLTFADTQPHPITITYTHKSPFNGSGLHLVWTPPADVLLKEALATASRADTIIMMLGLSPTLEGEEMDIHVPGFDGGDRTDIKLPAAQQQLLDGLSATGKPVILVLLNGSALAVPPEHVNAILEAWYPGEGGARAIANTLTGHNNPAGRLPITFYSSIAQLPAFNDYSMKNRTYRYFTGTPLYGFGYGLSYTHFAYAHLKLSTTKLHAGDTLTAEADITNTGKLAGDEVAELYLIPPSNDLSPNLTLQGFERLHLTPGLTRHVTFQLTPRQLSLVDEHGDRSVLPGAYSLSLGGSQPHDPHAPTPALSIGFTINGTQQLPH